MYAESDDDDKNSLNSSFWSDGEPQDEEEVTIERLVEIEALRSAEEPLEASGEEKSDLKVSKVTEEGSGGTDDEDEESCSSCDSPVLSFMTSGYGTYKPEEQEAGDCTSDCVDQDSRGHLSELRDDEDDHCSVCSNIWFEGHGVTFPQSLSPEPADPGAAGGAGEMIISEEEGDFKDEGCIVEDRFMMDEKIVEGGSVDADHHERPEEKQELKEAAESNESPCDQNIRFIDSKVDFSQDCESLRQPPSLRQTKGAESRLEERLSELRLSAQHDSEVESEEARSRSNSSGSEASSSDIFESYVRGLTRGDVKVRPKPKSFIRPVVNQRMVKKTDPVAKYFHYKRLWDVFKLPGEVDRTALRLEIKERLAYQPPPPKPRRVYMPNTYIVPTEKKRSALRWEIRTHLANEMIPYKCGY